MIEEISLSDFVDEFAEEMKVQLQEDQMKWGYEWRKRGIWWGGLHQMDRFFLWVVDKYATQRHTNLDEFPWKKVACEALIGWVRETKKGWEIEE